MSFKDRMVRAFKAMGIKVTDPRILAGPGLFENFSEDPADENFEGMIRSLPWRKNIKFIHPKVDRSKIITTGDFDTYGNYSPRHMNDDDDHDDEKPKKKISVKKKKKESPEEYLERLREEVKDLEMQKSVKKSKKVYKSGS